MEIEEIDDKKVIVANILPGMAKPYYLRKDGMMNGTYLRVAGVTRKEEPYERPCGLVYSGNHS